MDLQKPRDFSKLSVILPCCNEQENLDRFETELFPPFERLRPGLEFILVDDGSTDQTRERAARLAAGRSDVKMVVHERNQGLGAAVRSGLKAATGDAVLTMDADLTFHPSDAWKLMEAFAPGVDAVLGSPNLGRFEGVHPVRAFLSDAVNLIYRILLGRRITSTSSIFRLYRTSALRALMLDRNGFDINAEIVLKLIEKNARIREVPVNLGRRQFGVSKINVLREIKNHLRVFAQILRWRCRA